MTACRWVQVMNSAIAGYWPPASITVLATAPEPNWTLSSITQDSTYDLGGQVTVVVPGQAGSQP